MGTKREAGVGGVSQWIGCAPQRAMKQRWLFWKDTESAMVATYTFTPISASSSAQSPSWPRRSEVGESREAKNLRKVKGMYSEVDAQWIRTCAVQT